MPCFWSGNGKKCLVAAPSALKVCLAVSLEVADMCSRLTFGFEAAVTIPGILTSLDTCSDCMPHAAPQTTCESTAPYPVKAISGVLPATTYPVYGNGLHSAAACSAADSGLGWSLGPKSGLP